MAIFNNLRFGFCALALFCAQAAWSVGTTAGREINNTAVADFSISGVAQTPVSSTPTQFFVDEIIDVTVVYDNGGAVGVGTPDTGAILQFTVTNIGNGAETFRLIADDSVVGDDFDPNLNQVYLETNAVPGLQTGGGGDTAYVVSSNDPVLAADASQIIYVESDIPAALTQNDIGLLQLRAISLTIITQAGTDDPNNGAFPTVGTAYVGQGDLDALGGGNVTAVVGTTHDLLNLLLRAEGSYQVSAAVVNLIKAAINVLDPFGGATVVPGAVITYQIDATVSGTGSADALVVSDIVPADLEYVPGTLTVSALPPGENADDDFAPTGTDNTGFDGPNQTVTVTLGDVAGGSATIVITFQATIL